MSISGASTALLDVLKRNMPPLLPPEQIGLAPPDTARGQYMLGLHLYKISEDPALRLTQRIAVGANELRRPPMCLELSYMITAYAGAKSGFLDDHKILERVIKLFYDAPLLEPYSPYQPRIVPQSRVELVSMSTDDISKLWQFPETPQRTSLYYRVLPVPAGSDIESRITRVGQPDFSFDEKGGTDAV